MKRNNRSAPPTANGINAQIAPTSQISDGAQLSSTFNMDENIISNPFAVDGKNSAEAKKITLYDALDDAGEFYRFARSGSTTNDTTPTLRGNAGPNVKITVKDNGVDIGTVMSDASGNWAFTPTLGGGAHNLTFTAGAGSTSDVFSLNVVTPESQKITLYDALDDAGEFYRFARSGSTTSDTTPTLRGNAGPNVKITVKDNGVDI
ncbi:Ig-like domain-containing protein, partial [Pantoea agglomerans]